jgi:hypothetical protein
MRQGADAGERREISRLHENPHIESTARRGRARESRPACGIEGQGLSKSVS